MGSISIDHSTVLGMTPPDRMGYDAWKSRADQGVRRTIAQAAR